MILALGGGLVVVALGGFGFIYFVLFPTSSPKPFSLSTSRVAVPVSSSTELAGRWTVAAGSVAGYRVREKLAFLPAESDAVGRTSAITGAAALAVSGSTVTVKAASFSVDVTKLKSNETMRDQHIRTLGIQSATYPTATFVLSSPVTFPAGALSGKVFDTSVTGVFRIHGTSKTETVRVQTRLSSAELAAVGSLTFPWSEFNMTAPSVGGFVSVTNRATMEFDLLLKHG
ncbi:MAG: YceI family protein [Solirubrobacterales bacterium]|nr:YceI family protein [Solirubrobacterales bacterium]MBV9165546.1 YceI family protein [Solirubrobacterales bacterium]